MMTMMRVAVLPFSSSSSSSPPSPLPSSSSLSTLLSLSLAQGGASAAAANEKKVPVLQVQEDCAVAVGGVSGKGVLVRVQAVGLSLLDLHFLLQASSKSPPSFSPYAPYLDALTKIRDKLGISVNPEDASSSSSSSSSSSTSYVVPGYEFSGVVQQVGEAVTEFCVGDPVIGE
jgi:NADPH:quinone reductase-like Zn-dependent oxidoreductase